MALGDADSGATSICAKPEFAPIHYHWYPRYLGDSALSALRAEVDASPLPDEDKKRFMGEIRATMKMLRHGRLMPLHGVKGPMRSEPRIRVYEIRHSYAYRVDAQTLREVHLRMYHVEPKDYQIRGGGVVIGLHLHTKDTDSEEVTAEQDEQVAIASERFFDGQPHKWRLQ